MGAPSKHHVQIAISEGGENDARGFSGTILRLQEIAKPEALLARDGV